MEERGFDALQNGMGPALLIGSTVLLVLIILAGGYFMMYKERESRAARAREIAQAYDDAAGHPSA
jgi:hypothetical protein